MNERLQFEQQKNVDLQRMIEKVSPVSFTSYDLSADGFWKLLFDYEFFWAVVSKLRMFAPRPFDWRDALSRARLFEISDRIKWEQEFNPDRTAIIVAKSLRLIRRREPAEASRALEMLLSIAAGVHQELLQAAENRIRQLEQIPAFE